ncbi:MAG: hypothetical protein PHF84_12505 [bacterium]|nr:hypothetical protein [bacterium]
MKKYFISFVSLFLLFPVLLFSKPQPRTVSRASESSSLKFGVGFGLGFYPISERPSRDTDEQNKKWVEAMENPVNTSADYTVNELTKAIGILPTLKFFMSQESWIAQFHFSYMFSVGGSGDFKMKDSSTEYTEAIEGSATAIIAMLTGAPRLKIGRLGSIYLGTGIGLISITFNEKKTVKNNGTVDRGNSFEKEFKGSGFFMPFILGMETELSDSMTIFAETIYRGTTILGIYEGKARLDSATKTTEATPLDHTGLTLTLGVNMYFE